MINNKNLIIFFIMKSLFSLWIFGINQYKYLLTIWHSNNKTDTKTKLGYFIINSTPWLLNQWSFFLITGKYTNQEHASGLKLVGIVTTARRALWMVLFGWKLEVSSYKNLCEDQSTNTKTNQAPSVRIFGTSQQLEYQSLTPLFDHQSKLMSHSKVLWLKVSSSSEMSTSTLACRLNLSS